MMLLLLLLQDTMGEEQTLLRELAARGDRAGIAEYYRERRPEFYRDAAAAGLHEWLEGRIAFTAFRRAFGAVSPILNNLEKATSGMRAVDELRTLAVPPGLARTLLGRAAACSRCGTATTPKGVAGKIESIIGD